MNHHPKNLMVGCGFRVNEIIEIFVWLFKAFLKSMDGVHLRMIMTYQALPTANVVSQIFQDLKHRFCGLHLSEN